MAGLDMDEVNDGQLGELEEQNPDAEDALLLAAPKERRAGRIVVMAVGATAVLSGVCMLAASMVPAKPTCAFEATDLESAVKLFEQHHNEKGLHLHTVLHPGEDDGIVHRWLAEKHQEKHGNEPKLPGLVDEKHDEKKHEKHEEHEKQLPEDPLEEILNQPQVPEGERTKAVAQALTNSLSQTHVHRKSLAEFIEAARDNETKLKEAEGLIKSNPVNGTKIMPNPFNETFGLLHVPKAKYSGGPVFPIQQHYLVSCVFNVLQAVTFTAEAALDVNDILKTCPRRKLGLDSKMSCTVNAALLLESLTFVAAALSLAANDCSATIIPNVDTLCASAVTATVAQVGQLAGGAALAAASCSDKALLSRLPPQIKPSNFGGAHVLGAEGHEFNEEQRRLLKEMAGNNTLPGRRLILGGGAAANTAHCVVDALEVAWWLGNLAVLIDDAANKHVWNKCPPRNIFGGNGRKDILYEVTQSYCTFDIGMAIFVFAEAISFLQLAIIHCTDTFVQSAMCGAGISWIGGALAGIAGSGASMHLACDLFQKSIPHAALTGAARWDDFTDGSITKIVGEDLGRRLAMAKSYEESMEKTKARFGTPENLFKQMGFDLNDDKAWWRNKSGPFIEDLINLVGKQGKEHVKEFQRDLKADNTCA